MNNEQFRRLLVDQPAKKPKDQGATPAGNASRGGATPGGMLGSRMRSNIPMTPRSVGGVDFARQLAEKNREADGRPSKRFKSSARPKGTAMPTGYQDRAQLRSTTDEEEKGESIETRIKALEDMVKLGQIDQATFDKLRRELGVGGDLGSTHMVKGLDLDLLRRVRAGEDVSQAAEKAAPSPPPEDVDDEFDRLEEEGPTDFAPVPKEQKEKKKGIMAPPPARPKTRDEILRELKAKRAAAAAAPPPESTLGSRFKKLSDGKPEKKRFVEADETGRRREVLLITDAEGNTKRKTRWLDPPVQAPLPAAADLPMPDKTAKPLGMEVPADIAARAAAAEPEDEDDDIFAGVGDYNPLSGIDDDGSSDDEDGEVADPAPAVEKAPVSEDKAGETAPSKPRNYFGNEVPAEAEPDKSNPLAKDPTILAALKRAAAIRQTSPSEGDGGQSSEAALRQKRFIEEARRRDAMDAADMDMGFGGSRNEDDAEEDDGPLLDFDGDGDGDEKRGGQKRKRGPKKKKGDKDSATDVMRVVEGRKKDTS